MSAAKHAPAAAPDWTDMGLELAIWQHKARCEIRRSGRMTPRTAERMQVALAKAQAALVIDDAKATGSAS